MNSLPFTRADSPDRLDRPGGVARDRGSAMILVLLVMTLVTAMTSTIAVVTINNLQGSWRSRQAGAALGAADAGISQAVQYLQNNGTRDLSCSPTCTSNAWGNSTTPAAVTMSGSAGQSYKVWIEAVAPYPTNDPGLYRVRSTGSASGAASRSVVADINVTSGAVPRGIFAKSVTGGGDAEVQRESVFTTGCVFQRSKIEMATGELDAAYGIPIAVHSSQIITDSVGSGTTCPTTKKPIHKQGTATKACNTDYPYDQDKFGSLLTVGDGCYNAQMSGTGAWAKYYQTYDTNGDGSKDVSSLLQSETDLFKIFGFESSLTPTMLSSLKQTATAQGNYWTDSAGWTSPDEAHAVMFFDLAASDYGGTVDLNDITGFGRDGNLSSTDPGCPSKSLTIVIEGGNAKLNSNQDLFASLFLTGSSPIGQVTKGTGTASFIGTIYADTINLVGTIDISLDSCFLSNGNPALASVAVASYREDDRGLS